MAARSDDALAGRLSVLEAQERASSGQVAFEDVVQHPFVLEPKPRTLVVLDRRSRETSRPWHFVGAIILVLLTAWLMWRTTSGILYEPRAVLGTFAVGVLGFLLVFFGRPSRSESEVPLAWVDSSLQMLRLREHADQEELSESGNIYFEQVREVLYAERQFQPPGSRRKVQASGAAVFVRLWDGTVWPLIPATLARQAAYSIALGVAQRIGVGVKQVGRGWSDELEP